MNSAPDCEGNRSESTTTVAIAIRPSLWGELLQILLDQQSGLMVVGCAASEESLSQLMEETSPQMVIIDYEALGPGAEGPIGRLRRVYPLTRFLVLASRSSDDTVVSVLRAGASGLVSKMDEFETLLSAIRAVGAGEAWANRRVTARALDQVVEPQHTTAPGGPRLTKREREVVGAVGRGLQNREIARVLGISEKTVKTHLNNIFTKVGVRNRMALALWALDSTRQ